MQRKFRITVDGQAYEVTVEEITEGGRLIPQPGDMRVPPPAGEATPGAPAAAASTPGPAAPAGANDETSPLAGVVDSIAVKDGDEVKAGAAIVVLEAMKMKTTVVASRAGRIADIRIKVGDAVDAGQVLMSIE